MTGRLVIVEDHGLFAETVGTALRAVGYEVELVDARESDLVGNVKSYSPDLVLMDFDLGPGRDAVTMVSELTPQAPVVMMTGVSDRIRLARCIRAGAVGIVEKGMSFDGLMESIEEAVQAGTLMSRHARDEYLRALREHEDERRERLAPFHQLSAREAYVLRGLCRGASVEEIAQESVVSISTIRTQVRAVLRKLDVSSQRAATALARASGWLDEDRDQP